ncbi:hypothetical protein [Nostoc sp. UHCC 0252]|uniref:hypothetical protein n=1 Tax=Nostoc sp. UHCC 0252 TaxID=3110241 RepID=UPI002B214361|nr:hypothetical protein [Nostoc sp. UHCC 0252]MEA5604238.1 hypothetical protein [Nostoc sp. UHCC 0252]
MNLEYLALMHLVQQGGTLHTFDKDILPQILSIDMLAICHQAVLLHTHDDS